MLQPTFWLDLSTFVTLWLTNFIQKIRENSLVISEILRCEGKKERTNRAKFMADFR